MKNKFHSVHQKCIYQVIKIEKGTLKWHVYVFKKIRSMHHYIKLDKLFLNKFIFLTFFGLYSFDGETYFLNLLICVCGAKTDIFDIVIKVLYFFCSFMN